MEAASASHAGDLTAAESFDLLKRRADAVLVDVRTTAEWSYVGIPDVSTIGHKPIFLEWQIFPAMAVNEAFAESLTAELNRRKTPRDAPILFLCRSGVRSLAAAKVMTEHGYSCCLNVSGGFEGPLDTAHHRGVTDGWKAKALPWTQK